MHYIMAQMIANMGRRRQNGSLGPLRGAAFIAALAGAVGAVALTLRAGRHNNSRFLVALFVIWVLSPFIALLLAAAISKSWSVLTRATLYSVTLITTLASLAIYRDNVLRPPKSKAAAVFLVVPLASWLLIAIAVPLAALISGRRSPRSDGS
jgi:phosphate/sulfate permease